MLYGFLRTAKSLLGGLLIALLGAGLGSVLLSVAVIGGHNAYVTTFVKGAVLDGQELFSLMGTIPYGGLVGAIIAVTQVVVCYARKGDRLTAALLGLSGWLPPMICSGAGLFLLARMTFVYGNPLPNDQLVTSYILLMAVSIPFVASTGLVFWGVSRLIDFYNQNT